MSAPTTLCGCDVIARVRSLGQLDDEVPMPLLDAVADGLRRRLPTWLVRDPAGRLLVLVTNREPVAG